MKFWSKLILTQFELFQKIFVTFSNLDSLFSWYLCHMKFIVSAIERNRTKIDSRHFHTSRPVVQLSETFRTVLWCMQKCRRKLSVRKKNLIHSNEKEKFDRFEGSWWRFNCLKRMFPESLGWIWFEGMVVSGPQFHWPNLKITQLFSHETAVGKLFSWRFSVSYCFRHELAMEITWYIIYQQDWLKNLQISFSTVIFSFVVSFEDFYNMWL
jgi:hypothetical protein